MKVLIVNNVEREGPRILKEILEENEIESYTYYFQKNKSFPSPMAMVQYLFLVVPIELMMKQTK